MPGMGLLQRIFGARDREAAGGPPSSQFHESGTSGDAEDSSRNAPRRELVQVILRDAMRKHGIPSDWIDCRILSTVNRAGHPALHVNFVVKQAHDLMLGYVFAFQDTFEKELARFEPRAQEWLISLGWEFHGQNLAALMPEPHNRAAAGSGGAAEKESPKSDEDVQNDLKALFAIRDAAIADAAQKGRAPQRDEDDDRPDFAPTQPFEDSKAPHR